MNNPGNNPAPRRAMVVEETSECQLKAGDTYVERNHSQAAQMLLMDGPLVLERVEKIPVFVWTGARPGRHGFPVVRVRVFDHQIERRPFVPRGD